MGKGMEGLTPGRIVHYVLADEDRTWMTGAHRAAIVVATLGDQSTKEGLVDLTVFMRPLDGGPATGTTLFLPLVEYSPDGVHGTWHWIERA